MEQQQASLSWWERERERRIGFWFVCDGRFRMSLLKPSIPTITDSVQGRAKKASRRGGGSAISARAMQRGDRLVG
jgi:hypothetical protein